MPGARLRQQRLFRGLAAEREIFRRPDRIPGGKAGEALKYPTDDLTSLMASLLAARCFCISSGNQRRHAPGFTQEPCLPEARGVDVPCCAFLLFCGLEPATSLRRLWSALRRLLYGRPVNRVDNTRYGCLDFGCVCSASTALHTANMRSTEREAPTVNGSLQE